MTDFTIASFNVKNLIGADQEYYEFQRYTPEEYAWKRDWMADQMMSLDADIIRIPRDFRRRRLAGCGWRSQQTRRRIERRHDPG